VAGEERLGVPVVQAKEKRCSLHWRARLPFKFKLRFGALQGMLSLMEHTVTNRAWGRQQQSAFKRNAA
jgi:hypothetical protein